MKNFDVLLIGTPNVDIVTGDYDSLPNPGEEICVEKMEVFLGGGTSITGICLSRLNRKTMIVMSIHEDLFGSFAIKELKKEDVTTINTPSQTATGISVVLDANKDRRFITFDGSVYDASPKSVSDDILNDVKHVHLTNYKGQADFCEYNEFIDRAHKLGVTVSMDTAWDNSGLWDKGILELAAKLDIFFANETEIMHYMKEGDFNACLNKLAEMKLNVVIKRGSQGSIRLINGETIVSPPVKAKMKDSTGAGDSFNAGFIYGFLQSFTEEKCMRIANICGALSVEGYGGYSAFPTEEKLLQILHNEGSR